MLAVAGQEVDPVWLARGMKLDHHGRRRRNVPGKKPSQAQHEIAGDCLFLVPPRPDSGLRS